jgi:peptide/nickel transport system permease protein
VSARFWVIFLLRRLAASGVVVLVLTFGIFGLLYLAPGSIVLNLLGTRPVSPQTVAAIRAQYHLNEPFFLQYLHWLNGALHGDFGVSIQSDGRVLPSILARLPLTMEIVLYGSLIAIAVGIPLGIWAALRRGRVVDQVVTAGSVAAVCAPSFAVGLLFLLIFAVDLKWFPVYGTGQGFASTVWHITLPALALGLSSMGLIVRFTRAAMARELAQDYVVFAQARGLTRRQVTAYAFRNSLVPVLTASGLILTSTLSATVLVEATFALPGLGSLLVDSVTFKDIPVVQAVALLLTVLITAINLLVDVAYALVDPRILLTGSGQ